MNNNPIQSQENLEFKYIPLDPKKFGQNNFRVELMAEKPKLPFTKDQRNRIHRKLGIPSSWTSVFTWSKYVDRLLINGLAINGDPRLFSESIDNVVSEIIHCIAVNRIQYSPDFNRIDRYVQKLLVERIQKAISERSATLRVVTFFVQQRSFSGSIFLSGIPLEESEVSRLESFVEACIGDQTQEIIGKLKLFSGNQTFVAEIGSVLAAYSRKSGNQP